MILIQTILVFLDLWCAGFNFAVTFVSYDDDSFWRYFPLVTLKEAGIVPSGTGVSLAPR